MHRDAGRHRQTPGVALTVLALALPVTVGDTVGVRLSDLEGVWVALALSESEGRLLAEGVSVCDLLPLWLKDALGLPLGDADAVLVSVGTGVALGDRLAVIDHDELPLSDCETVRDALLDGLRLGDGVELADWLSPAEAVGVLVAEDVTVQERLPAE